MAVRISLPGSDAFRGELLAEGDAGYDAARQLWNGTIDRRPALIARCLDTRDVVAAIRMAADSDMAVTVRGGGHNVAGTALCDGALVIDLSSMRGVEVDAARRIVHVDGGATWGDVDTATQPHGLAAAGGVVSGTGVAGLTLNGGVSWQRRRDGMTIDNLLAAEVVTADGRVVQVDPDHHPDLFWALRGGGARLGAVTRFTFRLHPLGPTVAYTHVAYPAERAGELLRAYRDIVAGAPDGLTADFVMWSLPDVEELPAELRGRPYAGIAGMYAGPVKDGWSAIAPLRALGEPLIDLSMEVPYLDLQQSLDPFFPDGSRYFWKSMYFDDVSGEAADGIAGWFDGRPSPRTLLILRHLGGAIGRVPVGETPFAARESQYMLSIDSAWDDAAADDENVDWTRACASDLERFSNGATYLNFASDQERDGEAGVRGTFGPNHERLKAVRRSYDPDGLFR